MKISEHLVNEQKRAIVTAYGGWSPHVKDTLKNETFPEIGRKIQGLQDGTELWGYDLSQEALIDIAMEICTVYQPLQNLIEKGHLDFDADLPLEEIIKLL